jgi:hypothetical protein
MPRLRDDHGAQQRVRPSAPQRSQLEQIAAPAQIICLTGNKASFHPISILQAG